MQNGCRIKIRQTTSHIDIRFIVEQAKKRRTRAIPQRDHLSSVRSRLTIKSTRARCTLSVCPLRKNFLSLCENQLILVSLCKNWKLHAYIGFLNLKSYWPNRFPFRGLITILLKRRRRRSLRQRTVIDGRTMRAMRIRCVRHARERSDKDATLADARLWYNVYGLIKSERENYEAWRWERAPNCRRMQDVYGESNTLLMACSLYALGYKFGDRTVLLVLQHFVIMSLEIIFFFEFQTSNLDFPINFERNLSWGFYLEFICQFGCWKSGNFCKYCISSSSNLIIILEEHSRKN